MVGIQDSQWRYDLFSVSLLTVSEATLLFSAPRASRLRAAVEGMRCSSVVLHTPGALGGILETDLLKDPKHFTFSFVSFSPEGVELGGEAEGGGQVVARLLSMVLRFRPRLRPAGAVLAAFSREAS